MKLYKWQEEAFIEVEKNNHKCTVVAGTGVGKSFFGMVCLNVKKGKSLIVVPSESLLKQWKVEKSVK